MCNANLYISYLFNCGQLKICMTLDMFKENPEVPIPVNVNPLPVVLRLFSQQTFILQLARASIPLQKLIKQGAIKNFDRALYRVLSRFKCSEDRLISYVSQQPRVSSFLSPADLMAIARAMETPVPKQTVTTEHWRTS